jgi:hypothetical protein
MTLGGMNMKQYIFRPATHHDRSEICRLQAQFVSELADPLGVAEGSHERSAFVLVETPHERSKRAVGMMSMMRACSKPFVFEQVFPDVWRRVDLHAVLGRTDLGRDDLVEADWGYVEKEHRGNHLALLLWAGAMLLAHRWGYPVLVGIANQLTLTGMGSAFHTLGLSSAVAGVRYDLGLLFPSQIAPRMTEIVRRALARDPGMVWRLPGLERKTSSSDVSLLS